MAFKQYTFTRRSADNPRGDIISDIRWDNSFPDTQEGERLLDYLTARQASQEAKRAFKAFYAEYRRAVRDRNKRKDGF